jgi:hypothetical protein
MNILFLLIAFFLIGVGVYYLDLMAIKLLGKWFPKKFPQGKAKGLFVVGRLFRHRLLIAFIIVIAEVLISIWYGKADFQEDLVYGLIELVGLMAGFYGAAWFLRYAPKRFNEALDYAERVESGKTDVAEDLKNTMKKVNITAKISADSDKDKKVDEKKTPTALENPDIPPADTTKVTSKDLDKSVDDFIKKR